MLKKSTIFTLCLIKIICTFLFFYAPIQVNSDFLIPFSIYSYPFLFAVAYADLHELLMLFITLLVLVLPLLWILFVVLIFAKGRLQKLSSVGLMLLQGLDIICCSISTFDQPSIPKILNIIFSGFILLFVVLEDRGSTIAQGTELCVDSNKI